MSNCQTLTDGQLKAAVALLGEHKSKTAAARAAGLSRCAFNNRLNRAAERGLMGFKPVLPGFAIKQTSTQQDAAGNVEREWIQQHKAPGEKFKMPAGQVLKEVSALVDGEGLERFKWIKTKADSITPDLIEQYRSAFADYRGKSRLVAPPRTVARDMMIGYPIADPHFGMLSWRPETGRHYDLKIARKLLLDSIGELIAQSKPARLALMINLGDWQHTDDQRNMTPRSGHILDADGRYPKLLRLSIDARIECIELAKRKHEIIIWRDVDGNHDPHATVASRIALAMFYRNDRRVIIDQSPDAFFFHKFGATLIGATHGHKVKPPEMAMTMAVRRREDWGATKFHHFWFGHIHHESAKEVGDVRCESFQTIAAKDAHAASTGYNSGRSLVAITYHRRRGETGRHRVNIF